MATVDHDVSEQASVDNTVTAASDASEDHSVVSTPTPSTTPAPPESSTPASRSGGRVNRQSSSAKPSCTNELPIRQLTPHSKSTATAKSRAKTNSDIDGTNPAAIFSDAGASSVKPTSFRATPGSGKSTGKSGRLASSGTSRPETDKAAVPRQRSPWRPIYAKPRCNEPEFDRKAACRRRPSLSPEAKQRRPAEQTRASSTSVVRRTRSVPENSATVTDNSDPPPTPPVADPPSPETSKSCDVAEPARSPSKSPRHNLTTRSTKTTSKSKPAACDVIRKASKSAWEKVWKVACPSRVLESRPLLAALLFVVGAIIGACVYTYVNAPSLQEVLPLQPSQQKPASQPDSIWEWLR